jgi:hypothetical protein
VITPGDIPEAAAHSHAALSPLTDSPRWEQRAGDLDWTCRNTLDHMVNALVFYASNLALQAKEPYPKLRNGDTSADPAALLRILDAAAALLAAVARDAAPPRVASTPPAWPTPPASSPWAAPKC